MSLTLLVHRFALTCGLFRRAGGFDFTALLFRRGALGIGAGFGLIGLLLLAAFVHGGGAVALLDGGLGFTLLLRLRGALRIGLGFGGVGLTLPLGHRRLRGGILLCFDCFGLLAALFFHLRAGVARFGGFLRGVGFGLALLFGHRCLSGGGLLCFGRLLNLAV